MPPISTPCSRVCTLDPEVGLCAGCGRTPQEIATWVRMSEDERLRIMAELDERLRRAYAAADAEEAR
jgi:predicted Fe-S protein YdhL (DUF1289 family)